MLVIYCSCCTVVTFLANALVMIVPQPAFYLMNSVIGLTEELSYLALTPLLIYSFLPLWGMFY